MAKQQPPNRPKQPIPLKSNPLIDFFKHSNQLETTKMNTAIPAVIHTLLARPVSYYQENPAEPDAQKAPLTNIAFVLDCSGSMNHGKGATIEGFNSQVEVVREGAKEAGNTTFTDVHFSDQVELRCVAGNLKVLQPLSDQTYRPGGGTALYDAIGCTVAALLQTPDINSQDTAVLVTVFTDGGENHSRVYDGATIKAIIERLEASGRWTFALVGPLQTVTSLATSLSVNERNIAGFDVASVVDKRRAFQKVAEASESYMAMRKSGGKQSRGLYDDKDLLG